MEPTRAATPQRLLGRAFAFSIAACVTLVVADARWGIGFVPASLALLLSNLHWLFHVGTLVLSTLGAWIAFHTIGGQGPSIGVACAIGFLFGLASIVGAPAALVFADAYGCAWWLFLGAMFAACGVAPFVRAVETAAK